MSIKSNYAVDRRRCLQLLAGFAGGLCVGMRSSALWADDVSWLKDIQPRLADKPLEQFTSLLTTAEGKAITTVEEWEKQRTVVRRRWLEFLGPMPERKRELQLEVVGEERVGDVMRQLVEYDVEEGIRAPGYLLRPVGTVPEKKWPAIVGLHQTTNASIDEIAGVSGPEDMHIGLKMAKRGYVVFCPKNYLWHNVDNYQEAVARHAERHPQALGMMKMLYDSQRGVDVLCSLDDVDTDRIGAMGHSLGAKETFYLMAFDDRVKAGVASDGGTGFTSTNWNAPWYLGKQIEEADFPLDHHELIALIAPRPFLILAGEIGHAADGDRTWPYLQAALPVWNLYGKPVRMGMYNHRMGHVLPPEIFAKMEAWLSTYLV
ncbi:MAG: dienelactone hydrolase family protein [Planctomycetota bacterium]|nr:dienelactone hydrolase family protein [Planctomycetota bacterium]